MTARLADAREETFGVRSAQAIDVSGGDVNLTQVPRGIYVGVSGDLAVVFVGDTATTVLSSLAAGAFHPIQVQTIKQTGTTASGIVAGF